MVPSYLDKIAKILRVRRDFMVEFEQKLNQASGKSGMLYSLMEENQRLMRNRLDELGIGMKSPAIKIYDSLVSKLEETALRIMETNKSVIELAKQIHKFNRSFYLKPDSAKKLLIQNPPPRVLSALKYSSVEQMLKKESWKEVFCAVRFLETRKWMNQVFLRDYRNLTLNDFEIRDTELIQLSQKWVEILKKSISKSYHNISHLKELGLIYLLPLKLRISAETLRNLALIIHYAYEVEFYSKIFEKISREESFGENLAKLLIARARPTLPKPKYGHLSFLIVQKYLSRINENDRRLFLPHVSTEALFWDQAESDLAKIKGLGFWKDLNWVGDFFPTDTSKETLVSFNLVDNLMSMTKGEQMSRYLFHHQEALWNKIFISYFGEEKAENLIEQNIVKGWFEV